MPSSRAAGGWEMTFLEAEVRPGKMLLAVVLNEVCGQ